MNTYEQMTLWTRPETNPAPTGRLIALPRSRPDEALATRVATAPGLVRAGAGSWDGTRTPIMPLAIESAYADPFLLGALGARGARFARELGADVVVGAETAGVPLAASVALAEGLPFASSASPATAATSPTSRRFAGRRSPVDECCWSTTRSRAGAAVERFSAALARAGAEVVGVFVIVDMRDIAKTVSSVAESLPTESVATYQQVLSLAAAGGVLDPAVQRLTVDAIVNRWAEDDPRWRLLSRAA